jgi:hypothetical protein
VTWLRRPLPGALRHTAWLVRVGLLDLSVARGLADAVAGGRWILSERQPVGSELEHGIRALGNWI